jgi:hypothetical protein
MTTKKPHPRKIGDGFKATVIALSLMSLVVAWDLVARRDAATALAKTGTTSASPTPTPQPTATPWPTLTPLPALAPVPTLPPISGVLTAGVTADTRPAVENVAVASVNIAPPPSLPEMPTLAPLPEMPAPPPPPPPSKGDRGGGGGGGGGSRSKGS